MNVSDYFLIDPVTCEGEEQYEYEDRDQVCCTGDNDHRKNREQHDKDQECRKSDDDIEKPCVHCVSGLAAEEYMRCRWWESIPFSRQIFPPQKSWRLPAVLSCEIVSLSACMGKKLLLQQSQTLIPVHMDPVSERNHALFLLNKAVVPLVGSMDVRIIPDDGMQFVHAIRGARDTHDVAGFRDGIRARGTAASASGPAEFGYGEAGTPVVLTAMKFDPAIRTAAIIRFTPGIVRALESAFLECCSFDGSRQPASTGTMDWGVASCCREGVPDVIYDSGKSPGTGKVRLLGGEPDDVLNNIIILSKRILNMDI